MQPTDKMKVTLAMGEPTMQRLCAALCKRAANWRTVDVAPSRVYTSTALPYVANSERVKPNQNSPRVFFTL